MLKPTHSYYSLNIFDVKWTRDATGDGHIFFTFSYSDGVDLKCLLINLIDLISRFYSRNISKYRYFRIHVRFLEVSGHNTFIRIEFRVYKALNEITAAVFRLSERALLPLLACGTVSRQTIRTSYMIENLPSSYTIILYIYFLIEKNSPVVKESWKRQTRALLWQAKPAAL